MWVARDAARQVRADLGLSGPLTGAQLCRGLGLPLDEHPFPGRVRGLYWGERVVVRPDLWWRMREHVIFHEVGHHRMHGPIGGMEFWRRRDPTMLRRMERQAEEFAYFTALPGDELVRLLRAETPLWEIAERYDRWPHWVWKRVKLAWEAGELDALRRQEWIA